MSRGTEVFEMTGINPRQAAAHKIKWVLRVLGLGTTPAMTAALIFAIANGNPFQLLP